MGNIWAHSQRHAHTEEHGHKYRHVWLLHQGGLPLTPQKTEWFSSQVLKQCHLPYVFHMKRHPKHEQ